MHHDAVAALLGGQFRLFGDCPQSLMAGAVTMVVIAAVTATFMMNGGRSAWFIGALQMLICAMDPPVRVRIERRDRAATRLVVLSS